jgi:hypothetical protein
VRRRVGAQVLDAPSTDAALTVLAAEDADVVVTDIDLLPGRTASIIATAINDSYRPDSRLNGLLRCTV